MTSDSSSLIQTLTTVFDPKGTGYVTLNEIEAVLIANGYLDEKADVLATVSSLERTQDDAVSIEDIASLIQNRDNLDVKQTYADTFFKLDRDRDGLISADDLLAASADIGFNFINREQAELMISLFDYDTDGRLTLEEFELIFS
mmetsp:Transcript_9272/g.17745  ORF Transcript_9272/g.17745 Transcript_9272/m.17745 type:complete len:144 (+) Transcript_9272:51-482(+)